MLTKEEIFAKSPNIQSLSQIKTLNLWGKELENISIISQMPNLEIISLSANNISSLSAFSSCPKLKELYLRRNNISSLSEIDHLVPCSSLSILWIDQNPICTEENYHAYIKTKLPQLIKFDNVIVTRRFQKKPISHMNRVMTINQSFIKQKPHGDRESTETKKGGNIPEEVKVLNRYKSFGNLVNKEANLSYASELRSSKKLMLKMREPSDKSPEKKERKFPILIDKAKKDLKKDCNCKSANFIQIPKSQSKQVTTILDMVDNVDLNDMLFLFKEIEKKIKLRQKGL